MFCMLDDRTETLGFLLSGLTVVLFIIAVIAFIKFGGRWPFYVTVIVAFIVGFLNAWVISRIPEHEGLHISFARPRKRARRKRSK